MFISQDKEDESLLEVYLIYQSNQSKLSGSTKFGNISISKTTKNLHLPAQS